MTDRRPVILAGPTAGGKSALAVRVAERDGGCVINADASQVYGCWRVLTARPGPQELRRAPHALYGHVDCAERYSVGGWLRDLAPLLEDLRGSGRRAVIVGGTGLYLSALTEGLADIPEIPAGVRLEADAILRAGRLEVFRSELARRDPDTLARIDRDNPMRLQRAWEVLTATGRGLSDWHRAATAPVLPRADAVCMVVRIEKAQLINNIRVRLHRMIEEGALDECRAFLAAGLDRRLPSARVLGAAELFDHLAGTRSLEDAVAAAAVATRRFAKRQRTWFRGRMRDWDWIDAAGGDLLQAVPER